MADMRTEQYCETLDDLDSVSAIRAIHAAFAQINAVENGVENLDNTEILSALRNCMKKAGHIGFAESNNV